MDKVSHAYLQLAMQISMGKFHPFIPSTLWNQ